MTARGLAVRDADALIFAADMYGVQLDQLAALTGASGPRGRRRPGGASSATRETARLGPGPAWLWVTRAGLAACGLALLPRPARRCPGWRTSGRSRRRGSRSRRRAATSARPRSGGASGGSGHGTGSACGSTCPTPRCTGRTGRPRGAGRVGRRVLGGRGRAVAEDRRADRRDHAGDPRPHRGLRLPGRRGRRFPAARRGTPARSTCARPPRSAPCCAPATPRATRRAGRGPRPPAGRAALVTGRAAGGSNGWRPGRGTGLPALSPRHKRTVKPRFPDLPGGLW